MTNTTRPSATVINVNGKDFIVYPPSIGWSGRVYFNYSSTRNGERFGPSRTASEGQGSPKSVGRQLADAARAFYGDALIAQKYAKEIASIREEIASIDLSRPWAAEDLANHQGHLARVEAAAA